MAAHWSRLDIGVPDSTTGDARRTTDKKSVRKLRTSFSTHDVTPTESAHNLLDRLRLYKLSPSRVVTGEPTQTVYLP